MLLDAELRPWLMEVNLSPSLQCDDPIDHAVKSKVVMDLFNLVGVPLVPVNLKVKPNKNRPDKKGPSKEVAEAEQAEDTARLTATNNGFRPLPADNKGEEKQEAPAPAPAPTPAPAPAPEAEPEAGPAPEAEPEAEPEEES